MAEPSEREPLHGLTASTKNKTRIAAVSGHCCRSVASSVCQGQGRVIRIHAARAVRMMDKAAVANAADE